MPYLLRSSETFHGKKRRDLLQDFKSIIDWLPHADNGCETCDLYTMNKKGKGRRLRKRKMVDDQNPQVFWNELPLSQCCYDFVGEED